MDEKKSNVTTAPVAASALDEFSGYSPTWCPGCGDWAIGIAIKRALQGLNYHPSDVAVVFGIGCSGNMNDFLNAYGLHSLHGRTVPNAIGIKLAQHHMPVVCVVGDGDCYGEGGNHLIHACRGNHDITIIVHDNGVYGLTTGQVSPCATKGQKSKSTPQGTLDAPLNPLMLAISQGATFVAQGFAGNTPHLIELIQKGVQHKGFSLINILQPCVTFNKINTYEYYKEKVYQLEDGYDAANMTSALQKALEPTTAEKFPVGVLYKLEKPTYTDQLSALSETQLIDRPRFDNFEALLEGFC